MAYPQAIVEIAFDDGPYVLNPTWTDVTSYVWNMTVDRGRTDDWGDFDSFATVTLNNRTRRFDPYYTSGPYYGKLLPRKQIRIRATYAGTTYDVFRGFIDGWNPEWTDAGTNSSVTVSCFDALQLLGSEQLPADWANPYVLSLNPRHYYRFIEPISPGQNITIKDYGSYPQPLPITRPVPATELAFGLPGRSVELISAATTIEANTTGTNFTVSMWANYSAGALFYVGRFLANLYYDPADDKFTTQIIDSATSTEYVYKTVNTFVSGEPYMLTVVYNASTLGLTMYVNGSAESTTVTSAATLPLSGEGLLLTYGVFQQILVFHYMLSAAQVLNIYNYSEAIFPETTSARFNRIIAETPLNASLTSAPASPVNSVLDITNDAPQASDELRITAASEGGPLFVSKNGTVTMFSQTQQFTAARSITTQAVYGGIGQKLGQTVTITADGDSMRNSVYVSMSGGAVYEQTNSASATAYGVSSMSIDTHVQTVANAESLANLATGFGGNVYPDLSPVDVVLSADENWAPTLGLELMDRIEVNVQPPTGNVITTPMLVQRIRHEVVPGLWRTELEGSARWAAVFILDQSLLDGTDLLV